MLVEPERSDFNSNATPVEIPSTIGDSRAVGVSGIGEGKCIVYAPLESESVGIHLKYFNLSILQKISMVWALAM